MGEIVIRKGWDTSMSILLIIPLTVARFLGNETETCVVALKKVILIAIKTVSDVKYFRKKAQKAGHPLSIR